MDVTIPCPCPPKADGTPRHEQDTVTLPEILDFRTTLTIRQTIRHAEAFAAEGERPSLAETVAMMAEAYLLHTIAAWTFVDEHGKPVPVSKTAIRERLLSQYESAELVANAADQLYSDKVVLPLLNGASSSSPSTPTPRRPASPRRTSAKTNGSTPRRHSKQSSITTTPMAATGPMAASPGGVSSSSQS